MLSIDFASEGPPPAIHKVATGVRICLTTGRFIYTYLGTDIYAVYTTAGAFEDLRDHSIYMPTKILAGLASLLLYMIPINFTNFSSYLLL